MYDEYCNSIIYICNLKSFTRPPCYVVKKKKWKQNIFFHTMLHIQTLSLNLHPSSLYITTLCKWVQWESSLSSNQYYLFQHRMTSFQSSYHERSDTELRPLLKFWSVGLIFAKDKLLNLKSTPFERGIMRPDVSNYHINLPINMIYKPWYNLTHNGYYIYFSFPLSLSVTSILTQWYLFRSKFFIFNLALRQRLRSGQILKTM